MSSTTIGAGPSVRTRVGEVLKNWGKKTVRFAKKAGSWIKRGAKWALETKATQWVLAKTKVVRVKAWHILKGPVGWVLAPLAAIVVAPKAVIVLLVILGAAVVVLGFTVWRMHHNSKRPDGGTYTDEEWAAFVPAGFQSTTMTTSVRADGTSETTIEETMLVRKENGKLRFIMRTRNMDEPATKGEGESEPKVQTWDTFVSRLRHSVTDPVESQERIDSALGDKPQEAVLTLNGEVAEDETVASRYSFLEDQLLVAQKSRNMDLLSETQARMNLIEVRTQMRGENKLKADASPSAVYNDLREWCEKHFASKAWNWTLMYKATGSESKRYRELVKMQKTAKAS